jgi:hypothetical protein
MLIKVGGFGHLSSYENLLMLTHGQNMRQGSLVNGSVGKVVAFATSKEAMENRTEIAKTDDNTAAKSAAMYGGRPWPVVRFTSGKEMLVIPVEFTVHNAQGRMEARRDQVRINKNCLTMLLVDVRQYRYH